MREKWIDNAKGIAILLVIIGHTCYLLDGFVDLDFVFGFHLVMFFLLSGYTCKQKNITTDYINSKFQRLLIPFFFTCLAVMIMDIVNSWVWKHDLSIKTVTHIISNDITRGFFASGAFTNFASIEVGSCIGAIWFLPALFFALLIYQLILNRTYNNLMRGIICISIAAAAFVSAKFIWLPFSIQSGMFAVFFLWIGYEIRQRSLLSQIRWPHYLIAQMILLIGIYFGWCNISFARVDMGDAILSIPVGLSGCLLIYLLAVADRRGKLLSYLGRISLTILCIHLITINTLTKYIYWLLDMMGFTGQFRAWVFIIINILVACLGAYLFENRYVLVKRIQLYQMESFDSEMDSNKRARDIAVDVQKGLLILMMLIGYFPIDKRLSLIIYSCHMEAFIILSGYFYKKNRQLSGTVMRMLKSFILPYCMAVVTIIVISPEKWHLGTVKTVLYNYIVGMSFSEKLFTQFDSVGPIYFILLLFVTRLLYTIADHRIKNPHFLSLIIIVLSLVGFFWGKAGYWLPWSADIACYSLIFYHIGRLFREKQALLFFRNNSIAYFILSPVWAYMIYAGSMEIAVRNYGNYGIVVVGATAGTILLYMLSSHISDKHSLFATIMAKMGQCSLFIIIVHTAMRPLIHEWLTKHFDSNYLPFMVSSICIQLLLSVAIYESVVFVKDFTICNLRKNGE